MNLKHLFATTAISVLAVSAVHAAQTAADIAAAKPDPNGNLIGLQTENGKLVYNFIDLWFNQHKSEEAWDTYVAREGYMNHAVYNSTTATVGRSFEEEKAEEARAAGPGTHFDIKQIVAQGNLVFVHIAATNNGGEGAATGRADQGALSVAGGGAPAGAPPQGAGAPPQGAAGAPGGMPPGGMPPGAQPQGGPGGGSNGDGLGPDEMVMILRVKDDKIVDHWDMHIPTNSNSVVFEGLDRKLP